MLAAMRVMDATSENFFQYCERYWWVRGLYHLHESSVFTKQNNVSLTPQMGQKSYMKFVKATDVSITSFIQ
jgi:hypothetical protein